MAVDIERQRRLGAVLLELRDLGEFYAAYVVAAKMRANVPPCTNPPIHKALTR